MVKPITCRGYRHDNRETGYPLVLRPPQRQEPVGVMRRDPVAQKAGRCRDDRLPVIDPLNAHRSQPATVGGFANLVLEVAQNPDPFALARTCRGIGVPYSNRFRHHRIPPKSRTAALLGSVPVRSTRAERRFSSLRHRSVRANATPMPRRLLSKPVK